MTKSKVDFKEKKNNSTTCCLCLFSLPLGRELATLHHICVSYLPELQELSNILSIKKLVTVTDMLTKHKLKYREMIS